MKITKPSILQELQIVEDLNPYIQRFLEEDMDIEDIWVKNITLENVDLSKICFSGVVLENCRLIECNLEKTSFINVSFKNCDFSNSNMKEGYYSRCEFHFCKCVGSNIWNCNLKDVWIENSNFQYANLNHTIFNSVWITDSDFENAVMSECMLKKLAAKDTKFIQTNFFKTSLKNIDFTQNQVAGIYVSDTYKELYGAIIDEYQAVDLIKLLGVIVRKE